MKTTVQSTMKNGAKEKIDYDGKHNDSYDQRLFTEMKPSQ